MTEDDLIALFCSIDDFCQKFERELNQICIEEDTTSSRWWATRKSKMALSELMTIAVLFHSSGYRTFKHYYLYLVAPKLQPFFPKLVSYKHFNKLMKKLAFPLFMLQKNLSGVTDGVAFIDSTILTVCHICRASRHKTFKDIAKKGKSTTGWFFGMKLHLIINHRAEIVSWMLTPGNVDDRKPVPDLVRGLFGKVFGDRGYISQKLFSNLYEQGVQLITRVKLNMKNMLMDSLDAMVLRKRGIIETVNFKLKQVSQIEHHRHRSTINFVVNLIAGLISYSFDANKPRIRDLYFNNCLG